MPRKDVTFEREKRLGAVARLYCRGQTMLEIAAQLEVNVGTISRDVDALIARWKEQATGDMEAHLAREVEKCNQMERTAMDAFILSQQPREIKRTRSAGMGGERRLTAELSTEKRDGNPKFLEAVHKFMSLRCKLLGLIRKEKAEADDPNAKRLTFFRMQVLRPTGTDGTPAPEHGTNGTNGAANGNGEGHAL